MVHGLHNLGNRLLQHPRQSEVACGNAASCKKYLLAPLRPRRVHQQVPKQACRTQQQRMHMVLHMDAYGAAYGAGPASLRGDVAIASKASMMQVHVVVGRHHKLTWDVLRGMVWLLASTGTITGEPLSLLTPWLEPPPSLALRAASPCRTCVRCLLSLAGKIGRSISMIFATQRVQTAR